MFLYINFYPPFVQHAHILYAFKCYHISRFPFHIINYTCFAKGSIILRYIILTKKSLVAIVCTLTAAIVAVSLAVSSAGAVWASVKKKKLPIYSAYHTEKNIAFSFDAAWGDEDTQQLIDIFKRYDIKVTFFVVGKWVDNYPDSVKALADAGHEIENHSDTHAHMTRLSKDDMIREINNANKKIETVTGKRPTLFRAPYGEYNDMLVEAVKECGMYCIQWDVDSLDWKNRSVERIHDKVTGKTLPGSIVLFHNAALNTPASLPSVIETLTDRGYKFLRVSELIYKDNYTIDYTGKQIPQVKSIAPPIKP